LRVRKGVVNRPPAAAQQQRQKQERAGFVLLRSPLVHQNGCETTGKQNFITTEPCAVLRVKSKPANASRSAKNQDRIALRTESKTQSWRHAVREIKIDGPPGCCFYADFLPV
jgi:hypothetical protein